MECTNSPRLRATPIVLANAHTAKEWSVGVAVKKAQIQAAAWDTVRWAALLGGGISALSLLFALVISRRITQPIENLQQKASLLLSDPEALMPKGPPELDDLSEALKRSALDRNRSEQALRESEERFRGIFEHAATGIAITDLEGRFQLCNPAFSAMLGYSAAELGKLQFSGARASRRRRSEFGAGPAASRGRNTVLRDRQPLCRQERHSPFGCTSTSPF